MHPVLFQRYEVGVSRSVIYYYSKIVHSALCSCSEVLGALVIGGCYALIEKNLAAVLGPIGYELAEAQSKIVRDICSKIY